MHAAEIRLLRFLQTESIRSSWIAYSTIRNTEDLLPGDEKAVASLLSSGLIEKHHAQPAYRITAEGLQALQRRKDQQR
jgi:RIO-like serine/threonine protein kinase